jgi:FkbM family methyltransferase
MITLLDSLFDKYQIRPMGVLHLGANTGQEAELYQKAGAKIVIWVEAIPDVYDQLVKHVLDYPGSFSLLACVSDTDGERVEFNVANNEGQSSSFLEFGTHSIVHPSVKFIKKITMATTRVDTLLRRHHLVIGTDWFLTIDVQGAELLALRGMGDLLQRFQHIYVEVNERELYRGCSLVHEIDQFLAAAGFEGVEMKMEKQGWGDAYYRRKGICPS